jgi:hypothetical protein
MLADRLLILARRRWPLLGLLPRRWLYPLFMPTARRMRSSLARRARFPLLATVAVVVVVALLA